MTRMEENRKKVENWISMYQAIICNAKNVRAVLQQFDGKQFNKRLSDALYDAISDKKQVKLFCNTTDNNFDLEFREGFGGNYKYLATFHAGYLEEKPWQKVIGKTVRLNASVVLEKFDKDIKDLKERIVRLQVQLELMENLIAEHNAIMKQLNEKIRELPFEIRDAYSREFDKIMYI